MTKLGASKEGTLRRARITWTGRVFDRVIYSVLAEEWPRVSAILEAQMAQRQRVGIFLNDEGRASVQNDAGLIPADASTVR